MATKLETLKDADHGLGCLGKADNDEPVFVLRAKDKLAPEVVEAWARKAAVPPGAIPVEESAKVKEAFAVAHEMRAWQARNGSKFPD